jgi:hypothetical protein
LASLPRQDSDKIAMVCGLCEAVASAASCLPFWLLRFSGPLTHSSTTAITATSYGGKPPLTVNIIQTKCGAK